MDLTKVPFLDLTLTEGSELEAHIASFRKMMLEGPVISGPAIQELETKIGKFVGRRYAIALNSGTSSLLFALMALDIKLGDEVIVPCLSWIATANAVALSNARPVFADLQADGNICPKSVERLINDKVKAIIVVDYTGKPVDFAAFEAISRRYKIPIIEDAAQAFGAKYKSQKCGSFGRISCFSLNPVKIFGGLGEAGMLLTDDKNIAEKVNNMRNSGLINREVLSAASFNARMDTIQAHVLLNRFKTIPKKLEKRRKNASYYDKNLTNEIVKPSQSPKITHSYYTYTIRVKCRDKLRSYLDANGIETQIQHPILMCDQIPFRNNRAEKKIASELCKEILCLPIHEKLSKSQLHYVVKHVNLYLGANHAK